MSVVRDEFGPTLPELIAPRLRALPRPLRLVLAAVAGVVVLVLIWALLLRGGGNGLRPLVVHRPIAFNLVYRAPLRNQAPAAGELARLANSSGQSMTVRELRLPAFRGDASGFLPTYVTTLEREMARRYPGFLARYEGRANVNKIQGYEFYFQYRRGGQLAYGRRVLLLPTATARQGADLLLLTPRTPAVARYDAVGKNGSLKTALRSFRFGTERP